MPDKKIILTYNGLRELEDELQHLKVVRRKDVAEKIKEARAQGDLSENAEYDAAKEEQGEIETRIVEIENILKKAEVVDEEEVSLDTINVGCKVRIFDFEFDEEVDYAIVGSMEADPLNYKISNESPVGEALIGAKVDDEVMAETPNGVVKLKVLDIHR
ncbi:transcription elongation factor GreA [Vallitalea pronyensis]|uniref:Transcription elongation factor GreA n=1 Tax=Vallitalea pronyensis TaxID=1348613 RepID=A0A8J8MHI7_9FIRM|nr:transcription elongation factor GreA [Vallitalea pronyensis]QUI21562.1 transcription elongation factor GreA [Vallitalea pronyensis]